jgi:hypothetical protein
MPELSLRNIDQISNDIRDEEISFSHLLDDLIDHVCCDVEFEMQTGLDFQQAYQRVKQKMGSPRRLKEIQEETLYAVDLKYRKMKNTMKFSAIAGTIIFGFAALFKIQHWPLAGILMTLGALILAFIFMPSAMGVLWKETHNKNKLLLYVSGFITGFLFISGTLFKVQHWPVAGILLLGSVVTAVLLLLPSLLYDRVNDKEMSHKRPVYIFGAAGAIFYILGMLFKIQHWPAATVLMITGMIILGIIVLPWYTWLSWKDEKNISSGFIFMIIGSLLIIVPGAMINLNLQGMYDAGYLPHLEQQQKMFEVQQLSNSRIIARYNDSTGFEQMQLARSRTDEVIRLLGDIQKKLAEEQDVRPGAPDGDFTMRGSLLWPKLNSALAEYNDYLPAVLPERDYETLKILLEPSVYFPAEDVENVRMSVMSAQHSLGVLKNSILTAESRVLSAIAKN